jgi:hypothetical protein
MARKAFMVLGAAAPVLASLLTIVVTGAVVLFYGPEEMHGAVPLLVAGMVPTIVGLLWFLVVALWCLYDIAVGRVPSEQRTVWILAWFFMNMVAVWAWVVLYELKRDHEDPAG